MKIEKKHIKEQRFHYFCRIIIELNDFKIRIKIKSCAKTGFQENIWFNGSRPFPQRLQFI